MKTANEILEKQRFILIKMKTANAEEFAALEVEFAKLADAYFLLDVDE
jgi:hypothetical protein